MKLIQFIFLLLVPLSLLAQNDTVYYFGVNGEMDVQTELEYKKEIDWRSPKKVVVKTFKKNENSWDKVFTEKIRIKNDSLYQIDVKGNDFAGRINRVFRTKNNSYHFTDWQENKVKREGFSFSKIPLIFDGLVTEFYPDGSRKSESTYKNNELLTNKSWLRNGKTYVSNVFYSVDRDPVYKPGMQVMHNHILEVFKNSNIDLDGIDGQIIVGFVVRENGMIDGVRIEEGIEWELNSLAVRAFKSLSGTWQPAMLNGKEVNYYQLFPINFIHYDYDFDSLDLKGGRLYWEIN